MHGSQLMALALRTGRGRGYCRVQSFPYIPPCNEVRRIFALDHDAFQSMLVKRGHQLVHWRVLGQQIGEPDILGEVRVQWLPALAGAPQAAISSGRGRDSPAGRTHRSQSGTCSASSAARAGTRSAILPQCDQLRVERAVGQGGPGQSVCDGATVTSPSITTFAPPGPLLTWTAPAGITVLIGVFTNYVNGPCNQQRDGSSPESSRYSETAYE
jgi:hypothetical protein